MTNTTRTLGEAFQEISAVFNAIDQCALSSEVLYVTVDRSKDMIIGMDSRITVQIHMSKFDDIDLLGKHLEVVCPETRTKLTMDDRWGESISSDASRYTLQFEWEDCVRVEAFALQLRGKIDASEA